MKYFKKQTLRFEKAWNLKNLRKERTFSVMLSLTFFEQKEGSMKKDEAPGGVSSFFHQRLVTYDQN